MGKKRTLVFATGGKKPGEGGSGFKELVEFTRTDPPVLDADVVAVISNYSDGGIRTKAKELGVVFKHWAGLFTAEGYRNWVEFFQADFVMLSGWLKLVCGLDPRRTINIHPAPLPEFGGPGMHGHFAHEAVIKAYKEGKIAQSAVTIHYVIDRGENDKSAYDQGPIIFQFPVPIREDNTAEKLAARVNEKERAYQALVLNHVVNGHIWLAKTISGKYRVVHSHTGLNAFCPDRLYDIPQLNKGGRDE